jgi:hypothetical protein
MIEYLLLITFIGFGSVTVLPNLAIAISNGFSYGSNNVAAVFSGGSGGAGGNNGGNNGRNGNGHGGGNGGQNNGQGNGGQDNGFGNTK